jgi:hypothetical protein
MNRSTASCLQRCSSMLLLLVAFSVNAATTVYKVKNPDGSISYSDVPQDNAEVMQVEPVPTVPAVPVDRSGYSATPEPADSGPAYTQFNIVAPANDQAFQSPEGSVDVRVLLEPSLQGSHSLEYWLDGALYQTSEAHALQLSDIDRGTHTLQVKIVDGTGQVIDNRSATFTVHRPIIKPKDNKANKPKPPAARP